MNKRKACPTLTAAAASIALMLQFILVAAGASPGDCAHVHRADCGYIAPMPCDHVCSDDYAAPVLEQPAALAVMPVPGAPGDNGPRAETFAFGDYDEAAILVVNDLIVHCGLSGTANGPDSWTFATWDSSTPKKLTGLYLSGTGLVGAVHIRRIESLTVLDVSDCPDLTTLYCDYNGLETLDVSGCTSLQFVYGNENKLKTLDASGCSALIRLECYYNKLNTLNVSDCSALQVLACSGNELNTLDVSDCSALQTLSCSENALETLNLSGCVALSELYCSENALETLDLSDSPALTRLVGYENRLKSLDLSGKSALNRLDCSYNMLETLNLSGCAALQTLHCNDNALETLDVSGCAALQYMYCENNPLASLKLYGFGEMTVTRAPAQGGSVMVTEYSHSAKRVTLEATAASGYTFDRWTFIGLESPSHGLYNPISFTIPTGGMDARAEFTATSLLFLDEAAYDIPAYTAGTAIVEIDISGGVSGGTAPYTFSATGLPAGITISAAGVISGAPTSACPAGSAIITVTDSAGNHATIPIHYAAVAPVTFSVTYHANGATGGSVPVDGAAYIDGATVTVLGNMGSLSRTNRIFAGWSMEPDGSSTRYPGGSTFLISTDVALYAQWRIDGGETEIGGSGSTGGSERSPVPDSVHWQDSDSAKTLAGEAKGKSMPFVRTTHTGAYGVRGTAWSSMEGLRYEHETVDEDNVAQVRVYIDNPEAFAGRDLLLSGYLKGDGVNRVKALFEQWYQNNLCVIRLDQQADWDTRIWVAARVDLTGMDTARLCFYTYEEGANVYRRIWMPLYRIDKNGYLWFITPYAGNIIVSEGSLQPH